MNVADEDILRACVALWRRHGGDTAVMPTTPAELYAGFRDLGAQSDVLGAVGSWKDTLPNEVVLSLIEEMLRRTPRR